jgi:hypothetical protein
MTVSATALRVRAFMLLAAATWLPAIVSADYRDTFRAGIAAYRGERWTAAAVLMRQALQEESREVGRVQISGNETVLYLPSYFLGDALWRSGDCAGALVAFERARKTPAANNRGWVARMDMARKACGEAPPAPNRPDSGAAAATILQASQALTDARAARDRIERFKEREFGAEAVRGLSSDVSTATATLSAAEARVIKARQANDSEESREAERLAKTAGQQFASIESRLETRIRTLSDGAAAAKEAMAKKAAAEAADRERQQRLQNVVEAARVALGDAQKSAAAFENSGRGGPIPPGVQSARAELDAVAAIVARGTSASEAELTDAAGTANRVRDLFERARESATAARIAEGTREIEALLGSAAEHLRTVDRLAPAAGGVSLFSKAEIARHRTELARLRQSLNGPALRNSDAFARTRANAQSLEQRLAEIANVLGKQTGTETKNIPRALVDGARAYFAGRYADAAARLNDPGLAQEQSDGVRLQVHLLRAAALFSDWAVNGEQSEDMRRRAAAHVAECRKIAPSFEPDTTVFSPRFIHFYRSQK